MKKSLFLLLLIIYATVTYSQSYTISFAARGATTTIDSVKVDNLTTCTIANIAGNEILSCNAGDTLKLTGKSGTYRTFYMLVPTHNQTVTFLFANCTDADSNHYAVIQIGNQLWMGENLKTTKYRDGSNIPNLADSADWATTTSGAYCDYHNLPSEGAVYGHLYNFRAVADSREISTIGWHVASNSEWNIMEKFLDNTVDTTALAGTGSIIGKKLKENCNTRWAYNPGTWGTNESGFTALCTNYRIGSGAWSMAPNNDHDDGFWTSTAYNSNSAWFRSLRWCFNDIYVLYLMKNFGYSVRCVKDFVPTSSAIYKTQFGIKIYPNPAIDKIFIEQENQGNNDMKIMVYNAMGECVLQEEIQKNSDEADISNLAKGIYLIKVIAADQFILRKIIKE